MRLTSFVSTILLTIIVARAARAEPSVVMVPTTDTPEIDAVLPSIALMVGAVILFAISADDDTGESATVHISPLVGGAAVIFEGRY